MAIPNIIFSFYGMNVDGLPIATTWLFPMVVAVIAMGIADMDLHEKRYVSLVNRSFLFTFLSEGGKHVLYLGTKRMGKDAFGF